MLTFLIVFIGLSVLILGHEAGHFFTAKAFGLKVDEFGIGFPPRMFAKKIGDTFYSVNWLPFGGFVKIAGEESIDDSPAIPAEDRKRYFFAAPALRRALVTGAGVLVNFLLGWLLLVVILASGIPSILGIHAVAENSPAAASGVMPGDIVKEFKTAQSFSDFIAAHPNETVQFTVIRGNKEIPLSVTPRLDGATPRIGVELEEGGTRSMSVMSAMKEGFMASIRICAATLKAFYLLLKGLLVHASLLEGVVGPVGIFSVANQTSSFGFAYLLELLAMISLNLAVANLIPFPALDGGRLFLILIEKIKGTPVSKRVEAAINGIGFAFLILLMVLVTFRDVVHWIR